MRSFFLKHEETFLFLFHSLSGAASVLMTVAAIESNIAYLLAAGICFASGLTIWLYGHKLERSLRNSGSKEKTAWTKESAEKALNITRPRSSN